MCVQCGVICVVEPTGWVSNRGWRVWPSAFVCAPTDLRRAQSQQPDNNLCASVIYSILFFYKRYRRRWNPKKVIDILSIKERQQNDTRKKRHRTDGSFQAVAVCVCVCWIAENGPLACNVKDGVERSWQLLGRGNNPASIPMKILFFSLVVVGRRRFE